MIDISTPEKEYTYYLSDWIKCRDVRAGQRKIHEKGAVYLPKLGGMELDSDGEREYQKFKGRTVFYNATARTISAFKGLLFRKSPLIKKPDSMIDFIDDCSGDDKSLLQMCRFIADELLTVGRAGILVDYPEQQNTLSSLAEFESQGLIPYFSFYPTENILEARKGTINNSSVLTFVKLSESYTVEKNEFEREEKQQIRILDLTADGYRQRIFRKIKKGMAEEWELYSEIYPQIDGKAIDRIPFYIFNSDAVNDRIQAPPLSDLVDVNLNHYQFMASYAHGVFYTGFPTPYIFGVSSKEIPQGIGSREIWTSTNDSAKAGMIEFTGAGLSFAREYLEDRKNEMAALGAKFLGSEVKKNETAQKAELDQFAESTSLASIAESISITMTKALKFAAEWMGVDSSECFVELNKDYLPENLSPEMIKTLSYELQSGHISYSTFFDNLQRGEIINAQKSKETELDEISAEKII